ncbi:hypothetical protein F5880DRAFT_1532446 [Lentinula raphanica]|nr:hypothetical protein F5880DRAFT_1532446 [Lentinula raphanica]
MSINSASLEELVDSWLQVDQNEATRTEIQSLWKKGDTKELEKRMRFKRIFF